MAMPLSTICLVAGTGQGDGKDLYEFQTFSSYLQVSLGVARDLSKRPGFATRLLDGGSRSTREHNLDGSPSASFILTQPSPQPARRLLPAFYQRGI